MVGYEDMLDEAYKNVEVTEEVSRFEIPKVQGLHSGTKTILSNFGQIVSHIRREPSHLSKALSKDLASQGEIQGDRLILSRKLSSKDVNEKIGKYVNEFVICPKCKKPDTELKEDGNKVFLHCLACGEKREVHKI
jgi:translation initiation factor 2 subunit 2